MSWTPNPFLVALTWYPVLLGLWWVCGVFCYEHLYRHRVARPSEVPPGCEPFVTILVSAHNEQQSVGRTVDYLLHDMHYRNYEVLVVDDGSTDATSRILEAMARVSSRLRVIRVQRNRGKAHACNIGIGFARGELILCNDADTLPEPDAIRKYLAHLIGPGRESVAAVTGSTVPLAPTTAIGRAQVVEFGHVVDATLRSQVGVLGTVYSYNGANTMFRRAALMDVGMFRQNCSTEDIMITWDQVASGWRADFAPEVRFRMSVAESWGDLYRQRRRWAQGDTEVWLTNVPRVLRHPLRSVGQSVIWIDRTLTIAWSLAFWATAAVFAIDVATRLASGQVMEVAGLVVLGGAFVGAQMLAGALQVAASLLVPAADARERARRRARLRDAPLFILTFWLLNSLTVVTTLAPAVRSVAGRGSGIWVSPARVRPVPSRPVPLSGAVSRAGDGGHGARAGEAS